MLRGGCWHLRLLLLPTTMVGSWSLPWDGSGCEGHSSGDAPGRMHQTNTSATPVPCLVCISSWEGASRGSLNLPLTLSSQAHWPADCSGWSLFPKVHSTGPQDSGHHLSTSAA